METEAFWQKHYITKIIPKLYTKYITKYQTIPEGPRKEPGRIPEGPRKDPGRNIIFLPESGGLQGQPLYRPT